MKGLWETRKNLCKTYVAENFILTFGRGAQVRSEQFNSNIKRGGVSEMMRRWKLFEFTNHIDYLRRTYETSCVHELERLIAGGKVVGEKVTSMTKEVLVRANEYNVLPGTHKTCDPQRQLHGVLFYVEAKKAKRKRIHLVFIPDDGTNHPSCSCRGYKSVELPCAHIARVYFESSMSERDIWSKETFAPYWHIDRHPLYDQAKGNSGCLMGDGLKSTSKQDINGEEMTPMVVPESLNTRRGILHGICQYIIDHGVQTKSDYATTVRNLEAIKHDLVSPGQPKLMFGDNSNQKRGGVPLLPRPPPIVKHSRKAKHLCQRRGERKYMIQTEMKLEKIGENIPAESVDVNNM